MAPAVTVAVEDANGNIETGDNATTVALAIGTNPSGGTLTGGARSSRVRRRGHLLGTVHRQGRHRLHAGRQQHPGLLPRHLPGLRRHAGDGRRTLAFLVGPSTTVAGAAMAPAVTVAVEDANGNVETGDNTHDGRAGVRHQRRRRNADRRLGRPGVLRRGHLLGTLHRQGRHRVHAGGQQLPDLLPRHLVLLRRHAGDADAAGLPRGPEHHGRRGHHGPGRDRGRRGRQRQRRDRRQHARRSAWRSAPTPAAGR